MERDNELQRTTDEYIVEKLSDEDNKHYAQEFLKADFLASAIDALFTARRRAGLTQAQVAERLHTKQAAIARLEADTDGSLSLRRYVEYALACGLLPLEISLEPVEAIRRYVMHNPQMPRTKDLYEEWRRTIRE